MELPPAGAFLVMGESPLEVGDPLGEAPLEVGEAPPGGKGGEGGRVGVGGWFIERRRVPFPLLQQAAQFADGVELGGTVDGRGVGDGARGEVEGLCDAIFKSYGWLGQVGVEKLHRVRSDDDLGFAAIDQGPAPVMVECWTDVEASAPSLIPRLALVWLGVGDDLAAHGAERGGGEIKRAIEIIPR